MTQTRRKFVSAGCTLVLGGIAGCSSTQTAFGFHIDLINNTQQPHHVAFQLQTDGETLLSQSTYIPAAEPNDAPTETTVITAESIKQGKEYDLDVRLDDTYTASQSVSMDCQPPQLSDEITVRIVDETGIDIAESQC